MARPREYAEPEPIEVVWEAPPEKHATVVERYRDALEEVKRNPGKWARIRRLGQASAYNTVKALRKGHSDERWEFVSARVQSNPKERYGVFARYRNDEQLRASKRGKR